MLKARITGRVLITPLPLAESSDPPCRPSPLNPQPKALIMLQELTSNPIQRLTEPLKNPQTNKP